MSAISSRVPGVGPRRGFGRLGLVNGVLVALLAAAGVGAYLVVSQTTSTSTGTVRTASVSRGVVLSTVSATGTLQSANQLSVGFVSSGTLTAVAAKVGQHVKRGQLLGRIDATSARQGLAQAEASLATAQAQYRQTLQGETPQQRAQDALGITQAQMSVKNASAALANARRTAALDRTTSAASVAQARRQLGVDQGQLKLDLYQRSQDRTPYATVAAAEAAVAADQARLTAAQAQQRSDQVTQLDAQSQQANDKAALSVAQAAGSPSEIAKYTAAVNADQQTLNGLQTTIAKDGYAVSDAQSALAADQGYLNALNADEKAIRGDEQKIAQDNQAIANAKRSADATVQRDAQSVASAKQQVASAKLGLHSAQAGNAVKQAPPTPAALASSKAGVVQAEINVANARKALAQTTLRAPLAGVVASVSGTVGAQVSGGGTSAAGSSSSSSSGGGGGGGSSSSSGFVTLAQLSGMQILASFSETDAAKLRVGQPATVTVDALPGKQLAAHVVSVSPTATTSSSNVVTFDVVFVLDRTNATVRPGMTANVDVVTAEQDNVLHVPTAAVTGSGRNATVTVLRNGTQQRLAVVGGSPGRLLDGDPERARGHRLGRPAVRLARDRRLRLDHRRPLDHRRRRWRGRQARRRLRRLRGPRRMSTRRRRPMLVLERVTKSYGTGEVAVQALRGIDLVARARRLRRDHGRLGQRQVDADEPRRLPRRADDRTVPDRRRRRRRPRRLPAGVHPQPAHRVRLPELQPDPAHLSAPQRGAAADLRAGAEGGAAAAGGGGAAGGRAPRPDAPRPRAALGRSAAARAIARAIVDRPGDRARRRADREPRHAPRAPR